jgi:hypothetical protein
MYTKVPPKQSPDSFGPWSIFAMGTYVHANEKDQFGAAGSNNDLGAGTVGIDTGGAATYFSAERSAIPTRRPISVSKIPTRS